MRSDEAAAYYLSKGSTSDLKLATILDQADEAHIIKPPTELEMDANLRKQIRDALGFDFTVTINKDPASVRIAATDGSKLSTRAKLQDSDISDDNLLTNQEALNEVFAAIERLKTKWDKKNTLTD